MGYFILTAAQKEIQYINHSHHAPLLPYHHRNPFMTARVFTCLMLRPGNDSLWGRRSCWPDLLLFSPESSPTASAFACSGKQLPDSFPENAASSRQGPSLLLAAACPLLAEQGTPGEWGGGKSWLLVNPNVISKWGRTEQLHQELLTFNRGKKSGVADNLVPLTVKLKHPNQNTLNPMLMLDLNWLGLYFAYMSTNVGQAWHSAKFFSLMPSIMWKLQLLALSLI